MKTCLQLLMALLMGATFLRAQGFTPNDQRIGDLSVNYVNPEFSPSGNYMLWVELNLNNGFTGKVWHCGIDPNTGDLIPADGKGFSPFTTNIYARPADWGVDNQGPYYVGADLAGNVLMVRPTSATNGNVKNIGLPANNLRRAFYPLQLPNSNLRYLSYVLNDNVPGFSSSTPQNTKFQLRMVNLDNPASDFLVVEQPSTFPVPIPFDVIVPRWIKGSPFLTFGELDQGGNVQVSEFSFLFPQAGNVPVTNDAQVKVDGHPYKNPINGDQYFLSGIDGTDEATFYKRTGHFSPFVANLTVIPPVQNLTNPALNQSHEPFLLGQLVFSTYQVNNDGGNFFETTFNQPGEIWLTTVNTLQAAQWLLSEFDPTLNVSEPEPFVGNGKAWVYYSAIEIDPQTPYLRRQFQLHRCETPYNNGGSNKTLALATQGLVLFPNPVTDRLYISLETSEEPFSVALWNVQGQEVLKAENTTELDLSTLPGGVYMVRVGQGNQVWTERLVKR